MLENINSEGILRRRLMNRPVQPQSICISSSILHDHVRRQQSVHHAKTSPIAIGCFSFPCRPGRDLCRVLSLLVLLGDLLDLQSCAPAMLVRIPKRSGCEESVRTRGQALLQLLSLVGVLQDEGVEVLRASDLELGLRRLLVLLDPGGCK